MAKPKKIKLKKSSQGKPQKRIGYKIDYNYELNISQYEAVMHNNGAALVIAGAGTGKTRTLVYRVARLIEDGVPPESILLLTFTRKSSAEMLRRASILLDGRCEKVSGGTFHAFAVKILRRYCELLGYGKNFNIMDQGDSQDVINLLRSRSNYIKNKKRFPQKITIHNLHSASINRRESLEALIEKDYPNFVEQTDEIKELIISYEKYKKQYNLMDYDDLLQNLYLILKEHPAKLKEINKIYKYVMVDEYQDTNRLQHEIALLLAGPANNIMAVGDDAQSIYSFRGADYQNILFFPESFEKCDIFKIEENYRSTQPILDLTNFIIEAAPFKYEKELFTKRLGGETPKIIAAGNEREQSLFVVQQILDLRESGLDMSEIAVLFRSGFHSFDLEIELEKANIQFIKFGGIKFMETAHIKDMLSFFRILQNPMDAISWQRILILLEGVGPATVTQCLNLLSNAEITLDEFEKIKNIKRGRDSLLSIFKLLKNLKSSKSSIADKAEEISEFYSPVLKNKYDDWKKRTKDIETFLNIASRYKNLNSFLNDMALEPPSDSIAELTPESKEKELLTISTIHSAKGLEWKAVFLIWALEGRFPSARSTENIDTLEEERRLFYVACTRAKDELFITYPINIFDRESGYVLSSPSRFINGITEELAEKYILETEDEEDDFINN